jgi:hypothetical protein
MRVLPVTVVGALSLLVPGVSLAQSGNMMNGGGWAGGMGDYGGIWVPALCVILVVGVIVWIVKQIGR